MIEVTEARQRVVEAADRLFYARGVQAVGMDAVRAEAGVSLKRIYSLFPSKDDLVVAVLERRRARWDTWMTASAAKAGDARGKLLSVFDFLDEWFRDPDFQGCGFINVYGELGAFSPGAARVVREQKADFGAYVASLVREIGAPASLAPQIAILAEGAQTTAAIAGTPDAALQARAAAEALLDRALDDSAPGDAALR